jgi:hypothetical protein
VSFFKLWQVLIMTLRILCSLTLFLVAFTGCDYGRKRFLPAVPGLKKQVATKMAAPPVAAPLPTEEAAAPPLDTVEPPTTSDSSPVIGEAPAVETTAESAPEAASSLILYEDSFADVAGSIRRKIDGVQQPAEGPPASRTVYTFQDVPADGTLTLRIFEDNMTAGPDGEPGVLAMAWDEIPKKLAWSGFPYLGGAQPGKRMTIPKLQAARTVDDLRGLRLRFRYRGINANSESPVQIPINCRLEPVLDDSFKHRVGFGDLQASDEWQSFDLSLADGTNLDAFLKMLAETSPPSFKIVWGQSHPIAKYHAGDTLLIDDISVTSVPVPAGG